jgi:GTPase SAR1 family protein
MYSFYSFFRIQLIFIGKTTYLYQYTDDQFNPNFRKTVGIEFRSKHIVYQSKISSNAKPYKIQLQLWDTVSKDEFYISKSITHILFYFLFLQPGQER